MASNVCLRKTSASSKKVVVSDQLRTEALITRPPFEKLSASIVVNGHGPAMQESLAFRNSFPSPASRVAEPIAAFHSIPGEHGGLPWQGTFPLFTTPNVFTALPTFSAVVVEIE